MISESFNDVSDNELIIAPQVAEENLTDFEDLSDGELMSASQLVEHYDIDSNVDLLGAARSSNESSSRPFNEPVSASALAELNKSRFLKNTVDHSMWAVTVYSEWRAHRIRPCLQQLNSDLVYLNKYIVSFICV